MALRQRGKAGYWHAYFDTVRETEDGPRRVRTTVNLGTTDKREARALERELMRKNRENMMRQRVARLLSSSEIPNSSPPQRFHRKRRLLIADALDVAARYREIGESCAKLWRRFQRDSGLTWMDELTPDAAYRYLDERYKGDSCRSFNNARSSLNTVYRLTLIDSGLDASPFAKVPLRRVHSRHQRPFTEEEFIRIYRAAEQPWKSAVMIAWFTGLRQKDVFTLRWDCIEGDVLTTIPAKTSRFGRGVRIPIHPQLAEELARIPRVNERVLGAWYYGTSTEFQAAFVKLLKSLGIEDDERGIVNFNCFRDSFITRCDAEGVPRHATRGVVGHVSDRQTDLYSHDLTSARRIQELPWVKLE